VGRPSLKLKVPYGQTFLDFEISEKRVLNIGSPSEVPPSFNPLQEVQKALGNPVESSTIETLFSRGKKIAIVVDDMSRMTPTKALLKPILDVLHREGAKKDDVKIIVALGTHRPMTVQEMKDKYGWQIVEQYEVMNHSYDDESELHFMDYVDGKIPIWINKEYVKSDFRIATGNIVPHYNAGWGAGAKILLPGLAGEETVGRMHVSSATTTPNGLGMDENPTRLLIDSFAKRVGIDFIINTVTTKFGKIAKVFAGDFVKAHRSGVAFARQVYGVRVSGRADITISSSYPADIDYWQGLKGLFSADLATKLGGGIIEVTPCLEGLSPMHPKWIDYLQLNTAELKEMYVAGDVEDMVALGLALNIAYVRERHTVCIVSEGISAKESAKMGFHKFEGVDEALDYLSHLLGYESTVNVLTHGGETYPLLK
jgi:nickel-dependent lactate racemase